MMLYGHKLKVEGAMRPLTDIWRNPVNGVECNGRVVDAEQ